jgi:hypothetical protein
VGKGQLKFIRAKAGTFIGNPRAEPLFFHYSGGVLDGIAIGCVAEQLPDGRSLTGETLAQFVKAPFETMGCISVF